MNCSCLIWHSWALKPAFRGTRGPASNLEVRRFGGSWEPRRTSPAPHKRPRRAWELREAKGRLCKPFSKQIGLAPSRPTGSWPPEPSFQAIRGTSFQRYFPTYCSCLDGRRCRRAAPPPGTACLCPCHPVQYLGIVVVAASVKAARLAVRGRWRASAIRESAAAAATPVARLLCLGTCTVPALPPAPARGTLTQLPGRA